MSFLIRDKKTKQHISVLTRQDYIDHLNDITVTAKVNQLLKYLNARKRLTNFSPEERVLTYEIIAFHGVSEHVLYQ